VQNYVNKAKLVVIHRKHRK